MCSKCKAVYFGTAPENGLCAACGEDDGAAGVAHMAPAPPSVLQLGWPLRRRLSDHLALLTKPELVRPRDHPRDRCLPSFLRCASPGRSPRCASELRDLIG
jgi:hypothetical protein